MLSLSAVKSLQQICRVTRLHTTINMTDDSVFHNEKYKALKICKLCDPQKYDLTKVYTNEVHALFRHLAFTETRLCIFYLSTDWLVSAALLVCEIRSAEKNSSNHIISYIISNIIYSCRKTS